MKTATNGSPANENKIAQVKIALAAILAEATRRGFYGKIGLELSVQDGVLQKIRRVVERVDK
jgi:hypothetical protein